MKWNRNQDSGLGRQSAGHQFRNQFCETNPSAVLQPQCNISCDIAIDDGRIGAVMIRRTLQARGTDRMGWRNGRSAQFATLSRQEAERFPTRQAELEIIAYNQAAASASGGQSETCNTGKNIGHDALVAPPSSMHKAQ